MSSDPGQTPQPIRFAGDLELDPAAYQLRRGGRRLKLERIPLEILLHLAERPGQLVTREQIAERIWGKDASLDVDNSLNGAIRKIRQVLEDDPEQPRFIQTVTGRGYRFVAPNAVESASSQAPAEAFTVSAEELGRAIMTAAGLDPENPSGAPKPPGKA